MIDWVRIDDLDARLRGYPPIGVQLRSFFQARLRDDPAARFGHAPEAIEVPGLGPTMVWAGFVDSFPFSARSQPVHSAWGIEVAFPVSVRHECIDVERAVNALSLLPIDLARSTHSSFDTLPFDTEGFGVFELDDTTPVFATDSRSNALQVLALLNASHPARYSVQPTPPPAPAWIVSGPLAGSYVSRVEVTSSVESARRLAQQWSHETRVEFSVSRRFVAK